MLVETYKRLIDRLVERRTGVERLNVIERSRFSPGSADANDNEFVSRLSVQEREILAGMLERARDGGMDDALAAMQEFRDLEGLEFSVMGEPLSSLAIWHRNALGLRCPRSRCALAQ